MDKTLLLYLWAKRANLHHNIFIKKEYSAINISDTYSVYLYLQSMQILAVNREMESGETAVLCDHL